MGDAAQDRGYVVAVTGTPGGGKSTLTRNLVAGLGDAVALHFDRYEGQPDNTGPRDVQTWLRTDAHPDAWQRPRFVADLRALRAGAAITDPRDGTPKASAAWIVIDEPFGRVWSPIRGLVDLVVCIVLPLEIALARRILRTVEAIPDGEALRRDLRQGMISYLNGGRESYARVLALVRAEAEVVLDGTKGPEDLAEEALPLVRAYRRPA
jgi:uridine kinase